MADDMKTNGAVSLPVVSLPQQDTPDLLADDPSDPFNDVKKELRTRFLLLPDEIQQAVTDEAYQVKLFEIAKAQKLTFEELSILEVETTMVLLGMTKPDDYRDVLQEQLKKNDPEIDAVVKAVNEKVFIPVRAAMERVFTVKSDPADFLKDDGSEASAPTTDTSIPPAKAEATAPAASVPPTAQSLTAAEKTTLEKTGVVITETPHATPQSSMTMPSRTDVLKGIENPPKASSAGFVSDKLKTTAPVMPTMKVTDYSVAKPQSQAATPPPRPTGSDPYREPIN